ncbi:DUF1249 domain-containing protein [Halieaceae bacterium IMCC14734]|uniref:DUF1249 domain-containing protein n=1 Tax=Candidatus Litorirhabdus singularis TaxID=2518993 RepID=A0ABT3TC87_9GAMM|nr:DUF1249 domain-containing protein [Candidatus Litorirhabdus singularis]
MGGGIRGSKRVSQIFKSLKQKRERYSVDLSGLHATCESNYRRLLQLFPDYETTNTRDFLLNGGQRVRLDVIERCRYTTLFKIDQPAAAEPWLLSARFELRAYHDAKMVEVSAFQSQRQIAPRYEYPNPGMLARDEKAQLNQFLAEWFAHCLAQGHSAELLTGLAGGADDVS